MFRTLTINDCKNMLDYYNIDTPSSLKKLKCKAIELLINRMCQCYSSTYQFNCLIYKRYYNSRNNKNIQMTRKFKPKLLFHLI